MSEHDGILQQVPAGEQHAGMIFIPGATYWMGSNAHYPEEAPAHRVSVDGFWMDETPVTNAAFAEFVAATGHVTNAEKRPDPADYPGADPAMLEPASLVFAPPSHPVSLHDFSQWWDYRFHADWRHPLGPDSSLEGLDDHPVVHIAFADAQAYAAWAGKELATEAEWELAARAGLDRAEFPWGDELMPGGVPQANTWQGQFPHENAMEDGYLRTSPVRAFAPNAFGLHDMIGNVWEWTADFYSARHQSDAGKPCCAPRNPRGGSQDHSYDPAMPEIRIPRRVLKGGSHLCAPSYCRRYRPAARHAQPEDTSTSHVGFRCIVRAPQA